MKMGIVTSGPIHGQRRPMRLVCCPQQTLLQEGLTSPRSPTIALISVVGVIGTTWILFRLMAPQSGTYVTTNEEMEAYRGGDSMQTDVGNKTARFRLEKGLDTEGKEKR